jgi:hypothetical protein
LELKPDSGISLDLAESQLPASGLPSYQLTRTLTTPWDGGARRAKVALATSTIRPTAYGPRETTRQKAVTPVVVVSKMVDPIGASLLAQVPVGIVSSQVAAPYSTWAGPDVVVVVVVVVTVGGGDTTVRGVEGALTVVDGAALAVVVTGAGRAAVLEVLLCALLAATMDGFIATEDAVTTVG